MKKVIVGSENPVKINAVRTVFAAAFSGPESFSYEGVQARSGVRDQPLSDAETLQGAVNRTVDAERLSPGADFYVGLEGGVEDVDGELHEFAWIVIRHKDGRTGKGKSCTFIAPPIFRTLVLEGKEIGDISDRVFGKSNSKQGTGSIGLLTNNVVDRTEMYRHAVAAALIPFMHPTLYSDSFSDQK